MIQVQLGQWNKLVVIKLDRLSLKQIIYPILLMQKPQSSLQKSRTIGNYIVTKNLGEGTFGKVKLGIHTVTSEKVAIKILQKSKIIDVADVQRVTRQIHILKQIRHPNLIQLYEIIQTPKQLFLVMEYVSQGQLFQHIIKKKRLKQNEACEFFRQLIQGIEYLHELNVVHRDLKPENLLIDFNKRLKIVDFGLSNTYKNKELLKTACGSPCYAAPQMIAGKKYHGLGADIWSCGVILYAMICGYLPFQDPNTALLYKKITAGEFTIPKFVSPFGRELLQRILTTDPDRRVKISQIKRHAWYRQPIQLGFTQAFGIKIGVNNIPIDQDIITQVISNSPQQSYQQTRNFVFNNRHNHAATIYYLLLKRNLRNGISSKYDICSSTFENKFLQRSQAVHGSRSNCFSKSCQDIQQIQLDRNTTATGSRAFRAFSRGNSIRTNNTSDSPDITAHNFNVVKNKSKPKKSQGQETTTFQNDSSQFNAILDKINHQPTSQRRKIYFQAQTNSILTDKSIELKSLKIGSNPQPQTQRLFQKQKLTQRPQKQTMQISLYNVEDKRQALSHFYHQERKNTSTSTRQPGVSFRTSVNRSIRIPSTYTHRKYQDFQTVNMNINTPRQSIGTRDGFAENTRYASLDVNDLDKGQKRNKRNDSRKLNAKEFMNRTFVGSMTGRTPKVWGYKVDNQCERIKSILNSTITTEFSKRRNSTRQKDERPRFDY